MGLSFAAQAHTPVRWYFNPRAPCGARPAAVRTPAVSGGISIHAPLAGRDIHPGTRLLSPGVFQSTRPLQGATFGAQRIGPVHDLFQSTRPLRGATRMTW